ncbi:MAG: peptide deformylase [Rickettsiales bacterium]|nr:peptide deformylase [Rickettsiales bacterium]
MNDVRLRFVGDPVLRARADEVSVISADVLNVLSEMENILKREAGAGLAAPQVGVPLRMLVFMAERGGPIFKAINPKIISHGDDSVVMSEGCLSVQGEDGPVFVDLERFESVVVEWIDEVGVRHEEKFSGFAARVMQHEIDHLDGVLFIDYLSSAKREMVMRKVKKKK